MSFINESERLTSENYLSSGNWESLADFDARNSQVASLSEDLGSNWEPLPKTNEELAREKMRLSFFQNKGLSPEKAAKALSLADEFDVSPSLILANTGLYEARSLADKANKDMTGLTRTMAFLGKDPVNTALFSEDMENAGDFEKLTRLFQGRQTNEEKFESLLFSERARFEPNRSGNNVDSIGLLKEQTEESSGNGGFLDRTGQAFKEGTAEFGKAFVGFSQAVYENLDFATSWAGVNVFEDLASMTRQTRANIDAWGKDGAYERAEGAMGIWEDFVKSSPQMVSQIATALLSGGWGAAVMMGTQLLGGQYGQTREEGVSQGRAIVSAMANAGIQMPLEKFQMGSLLKVIKDSGLGRMTRNLTEATLTSLFTEMVQNYPDDLTNRWARAELQGFNSADVVRHFFQDIGETTLEGLYEGALTLPYVGLASAGRFTSDYKRYQALKADTSLFEALDVNAQNSKVRARLPKAYHDFVDYMVESGDGANTIYVTPTEFRKAFENNGENTAIDDDTLFSFLDKVGVKKKDFEQAEALGANIEIPLGAYQKEIAGTDLSLRLRGHVSTSADAMSLEEMQIFEKDLQANVSSIVEETRAHLLESEELETALLPIRENLERVYGKDGAEQNMAILRARAVMGARAWSASGESMTPAQWITDKWNVQVQSAFSDKQSSTESDLYQALDRTNAKNIDEFIERARSGALEYFVPEGRATAVEKALDLKDVKINIRNNFVQHLDNEREEQTVDLLHDVENVLQNADKVVFVEDKGKGKIYVAIRNEEGNQATGVAFTLGQSNKKGNLVAPITMYTGHVNSILNTTKQKIRAATIPRAAFGVHKLGEESTAPNENIINDSSTPVKQNEASENLNQDYPEGVRGSISFTQDVQGEDATIIKIFRDSADMSTFVHEIGHLFIRDMEELVATGKAPQGLQEDVATLTGFTAEYSEESKLQEFYESHYQPTRKEYVDRDFSSLRTDEKSKIQRVAEQEKLADAFVTYLKEGNAPSAELKTAFSRFRDWLTSLYKTLRNYVSINDDVRGVFDRMLATDQEIASAEAGHRSADSNLLAVAHEMLTVMEKARLAKSTKQAQNMSKEARLSKTLQAYFRSLAFKKEIVNTAKETVNSMPIYAVQEKALSEGGFNLEDVREEFGEATTKKLMKKRPGLFRNEGTVSLYEAALAYNFPSTEAFVDGMLLAESKSMLIKRETERLLGLKEKEIRAQLEQDLGLHVTENGELDFYNDERLNTLLFERLALRRKNASNNKAGANVASSGLARAEAKKILESMPHYQALSIAKLSSMEAKSAREAGMLLERGDLQGAEKAKNKQVIAHAMVLEALEAREKVERFKRRLKGLVRNEKMDFAYQEQIRFLSKLYKIGGNQSYFNMKKPDERQNLKEFIDSVTQDSIFEAPPFADFVLSETVPQAMTLGQLEEVMDVIVWLGREGQPAETRLLTQEGTLFDAVKKGSELLETCGSKYVPKEEGTAGRAVQDFMKDVFAGLNQIKFMFMRADGYQEIGKNSHNVGFHSNLFNQVVKAQNKQSQLFRDNKAELDAIGKVREGFSTRFEKEFGKRAKEIKGVSVPEIMQSVGRYSFTAEHIWCLARNMGNEGNLKTLYEGYGFSEEALLRLTSILSTEEWNAIASEGRLMGKHYEETDAVFRQIYGRPMPDKVEARELSVRTSDSEELLNLSGWYFPISIDNALSPEIADKKEMDMIKGSADFTAFGPSMAKGHTKGRTGTARPVALNYSVFEGALWDQWRFMTHAPVVRDLDKLTRAKEWRTSYTNAFGKEHYDEVRSWLKFVARPTTDRGDRLDSFINNQRKLATYFMLGINAGTFLRQFQGYFPAIPDLGASWVMRGVLQASKNPLSLVRTVNEMSPFMADRDKNFVRELRKDSAKLDVSQGKMKIGNMAITKEDVQEFSMSLVALGDRLTSYPIWQGAYQKGVSELNLSQDEAIAYADGLIQKTQASNTVADLNLWQREDGKSWKRLYSMFMSEALRKGSRMRYYYGALQNKKITKGKYLEHVFMESVVPAMFYVGLKAL